jgi:hypothetical protein
LRDRIDVLELQINELVDIDLGQAEPSSDVLDLIQ